MIGLRKHRYLATTCLLFCACIVFINPIREMALSDDWAYARTVQHLLETGVYQLDQWLSANMPFQAFWGAGFSRVLGFSFSTLRLSTLALTGLGLLACYGLVRAHGFSHTAAGLPQWSDGQYLVTHDPAAVAGTVVMQVSSDESVLAPSQVYAVKK